MDNFKNEVSFPRSGMSKGTDPRNLKENEYTYALNTNLSSVDGDYIDISYEKSNILSVNFPEGFKVIGKFNRLLNNRTYYFLHNPKTKKNKFGFVDNNFIFNDKEDELTEDGSILAESLEDVTQQSFKEFTVLLEDNCTENGFNFRIDRPIKNPLLKEQKTGGVIYFTDAFNPPRYIELDNIETYFTQEQPCDDDLEVDCPLFDKMLLHKKYNLPNIVSSVVTNGGSLKKGSYSFVVALSDALGTEISEYFSVTQPTDVWEVGEGIDSSKAIKVILDNLDTSYTHYKLVVFYTEKDSRITTAYDVGTYSINQTEVVITDLSYAQRTSLEKISFVNQRVLTSEGFTSANNSLLSYGLVFEEELNLQPVVNLLGSYLEWQTHIAKEDLYEYGDMRSKYLGINRNEVVPYGIRFLKKGGSTTAIFPLVGREAQSTDRQLVTANDKNRKSYELSDTCEETERKEKWQYFNTAQVLETYSNSGTVEVVTESVKECNLEDVFELAGNSISVDIDSSYETLQDYIDANFCDSKLQAVGICSALSDTYPSYSCDTSDLEANCQKKEDISREAYISSVENERVYFSYEDDFGTYSIKDNSFSSYDPFEKSGNGYVKNTQVPTIDLYERNNNIGGNNTLLNAVNASISNYMYQSNFKIIPCTDRNTLSTTNYYSPNNLSANLFNTKITDNSQWFYVDLSQTGKFVSITKAVMASVGEPFPSENFSFSPTQRISFFEKGNNNALYSFTINLSSNSGFLIYKNGTGITIKRSGGISVNVPNVSANEIYFVVEQGFTPLSGAFCIKHATTGGYQVYAEDLVVDGKFIAYDSIQIGLVIKYKVTCTTTEPTVTSCQAIPYQRGTFSYHESALDYPDNPELYDSTKLKIKSSQIPAQYRQNFISRFTQGTNPDGTLRIKNSFNLTCKPIRHFKFPDNGISPFMTSNTLSPFGESSIYPIGVTINEDIINVFLDIAKDNGLITEEDRKNIYGYEIFRGNLATNRSVVASGLCYDLRKYTENNKEVLYPNYPYNSFGRDYMNQLNPSSNLGDKGSEFTFHSPETDYTTNTQASEMKIEGYQFGYSKGNFDEVEQHPKWVVLTNKADDLASTLATIEVATEIAIEGAHAASNAQVWVVGGLGSTGTSLGIPAFVASATILALGVASGILYRYAKYKQEWLNIIENLGVSHNFAYYYYSTGNYNYLKPLQDIENSVRNLQSYKFIKDGRLNITNRITKEKYDINNIDREWSTFLAIGEDNNINYPTEYANFDKESIVYQGKEGIQSSGRSQEVTEKIASMYVHLVNYNSALHGEISSINWITTSYKGDLENPSINCLPIFGGDTFISRHTLKRKIPLFLTTAMGQSGTTPFEYKFYNNIGTNPLFYVNYKVESDYSRNGKSLPVIKSEFKLDNESGKKFYYVAPSKFYLYYYGIPSFLTETRINTNYREYGRTAEENFYPNVGDIGRWTQETNVKLREPNYFKYDFTYSSQANPFNSRVLPSTYKKKNQDIVENAFNGVMFSLPDYNENGQVDPWLKFRPLDFYEFDTKYGKLKELKGIENEAILARFEHTAIIYNKVSSTVDDGQSPSTYLGGRDIFQRRTVSFVNSELGFGGTQHNESLSCEYGHFYVDNDRGQVIQIPTGGGNMAEISSINSSGKPTNMKDWFKRHLPYKLLNSGIIGIDKLSKDNAYNYIGTNFGYDPLHKRVLITKKDYLPIADCPIYYTPDEGFYTDGCVPPEVRCPEGFEKVTEIVSCGLRLATIIDNATTFSLNTSIEYFKQLLSTLTGEVIVSFYYFRGNNPIIQENLSLAEAIVFINSFTGVTDSNVIINEALCAASTWLNQDLNKYRVIHGSYHSAVPGEVAPDFNCSYLNSTNTKELTDSAKESGIINIGTGDGGFIANNRDYLSPEMWENSITPTQKIINQYKSFECSGENEVIDTCKKVTVSSPCPSGYRYNASSGMCEPINKFPVKDKYDTLDVVYYLGYRTVKSQYDESKNAILASLNALDSLSVYTNNRYALVTDEYLKTGITKYRNIVPFTTNKQDIINALNSLVHKYEATNLYYSPDDLAIEGIMMNYKERSAQDNSFVQSTNSIGEFRPQSNVGKVIYKMTPTWVGSGLRMEYRPDGSPTYSFLVSGDSKEHWDYINANRQIMLQKNIQIFTFENSHALSIEPSPANNYHESSTYSGKYVIATTPCFHYYESYFYQDRPTQIVQSIGNIGYRSCEAEDIAPECECALNGQFCECVEYSDLITDYNKQYIDLDNKDFFKEVSWTIAYYPEYGQFSSFYSYYPNYYVNHFRTFETGRNDLNSLWSHNSTNKSFGVFYGKAFPMEIELIVKSQLGSYIGSVGMLTESKRYFNNEDFYLNNDLTFNKSVIYNRKECSGLLHLDLIKGHTRYLSEYPITVSEKEQRIPLTKSENFFNYNYFYNRVIKTNNKPFIKNDINELKIDLDNISFNQGRQLGRLNGDYFLNRLTYDKDSRFCLTIKLQKSLTNLDNM